jgi:hypothetical protein
MRDDRTPVEQFWANVAKGDGCWEWQGVRKTEGYGRWGVGIKAYGHGGVAHRMSWILANGPIPAGMLVCHRCDNPPCVRPDHLFLGTAVDNNRDRDAKGRARWLDREFQPSGEKSHAAKYSDVELARWRHLHYVEGLNYNQIATSVGCTREWVRQVVKGNVRKAA